MSIRLAACKARAVVASRMEHYGFAPLALEPCSMVPSTMAIGTRISDYLCQHITSNLGWQMGQQPNGQRLLALIGRPEELSRVSTMLGPLPITRVHREPAPADEDADECHIFRVPVHEILPQREKLPGLAIRSVCDVGHILVPPSEIEGGWCTLAKRYPVGPLSESWLALLRRGAREPVYIDPSLEPSLERALKYTEHCEPAQAGASGHHATFRVACKALEFGLGFDGIMTVLQRYNQRCSPQWSERDLAHKARSAIAQSKSIKGSKLTRADGR